jgi:hypothetical protein
MNRKLQIVYQEDEGNKEAIHWLYHEEERAMKDAGIITGIYPSDAATDLIYRGEVLTEEEYPKDPRFVNNVVQYSNYLRIFNWYHAIEELTIESFFTDDLDNSVLEKIKERGWHKAFIKDASKSLAYESIEKCIWPNTSLKEIKEGLSKHKIKGQYTIRKYLEPHFFDEEKRYWIINGNPYHSSGNIPDIVRMTANKLNKFGGRFYVIDATPKLIVEVNPGEPAVRHADNPAEDFAKWLKSEFN